MFLFPCFLEFVDGLFKALGRLDDVVVLPEVWIVEVVDHLRERVALPEGFLAGYGILVAGLAVGDNHLVDCREARRE